MSETYIALPLKDGTWFFVQVEDGVEYEHMFPNINVAQEFCAMKVWLDANVERRKTRRGIKRFIANWLIHSAQRSFVPSRVAMEAAVGRQA